MLNQFKIHCIIRLTFEAYVYSLNVLKVCGKYILENQYVEESGLTLLFVKWYFAGIFSNHGTRNILLRSICLNFVVNGILNQEIWVS